MKPLTNRDIAIAKMIWDKVAIADIAKKYDCSTKTIQRKQKEPAFAEYFASLKKSFADQIHDQVQEVVQSATVAKIEIFWDFNESARNLREIVYDGEARDSDRIAAIKLLNEQFGISRVVGESESSAPDVFQADWMRKTAVSERYRWQPATEAQRAAINSQADILLFGGSAGSLKTETMLMDAVQEYKNPNLRGIIFRSSFQEMTDIVDKTRRLYTPLGGEYVGSPKCTWTFASGATIRFAYMRTDDDVWKYLGPRYSFIGFDESTLHTEKQVRNILGRLSSTDTNLRLRVRLTTNPGNIGAAWHLKLFLRDKCPVHNPAECAESGKLYMDRAWSDGEPIPFSVAFIPGKLSDHKLLDPKYPDRLRMMSGDAAEGMLKGCWCRLEGSYFPFLSDSFIRPYAEADIQWWHSHFLSLDYGFGKSSSSVGLYVRGPAEVKRSISIPGVLAQSNPGASFPDGRIRKIGELVAPHIPAYELAQMAVDRFIAPDEQGQRRRIVAAYLDPANFKDIGDGHTIADQINEVFEPWEVTCTRASNDRLGGWQLLYKMLRSGEFEITDTCPKTFEALRTRMHDDKKPGDIKKVPGDPLDDVADETRYALYTFIEQASKPRELVLAEAVKGIPLDTREGFTSAGIRYQIAAERYDAGEAPVRMGTRLGLRRR